MCSFKNVGVASYGNRMRVKYTAK
ncbi:MAG: DUF6783 domain-containing protein [Lachnospiraceae bacterium]